MKVVQKEELANLLEFNILEQLQKNEYEILEYSPHDLLSYRRFDIAFKVIFLSHLTKNYAYGKYVYETHIKAFSLGKFKEPNNSNKNSSEKFIEVFLHLYNSFKEEGFNHSISIIPLSTDNILRNGAHRFSCALFENKKVYCINTESSAPLYNYRFFYERNVPVEVLDATALKFAELSKKTQLALVWPSAVGHDTEIEDHLGKVIYKKEIYLNLNGAHNLMSQVYEGEPWVGNIQNDYKGTIGKTVECFKNDAPLRVILFEAESLEHVLIAKENIRQIFKIGKHAIHITDTHDEVLKLSRILFNDNGIHFLNFGKPNKFMDFHQKLASFAHFINMNDIDSEDIVLDTGMVMSLYGLRKCRDIDYLTPKDNIIKCVNAQISSHQNELIYHDKSLSDLVYDPRNYFYYNGFKFIGFNQLNKFKKNRKGEKDKHDLVLMDSIFENDKLSILKGRISQKAFYYKHKIKSLPIVISIKIFKSIGIYDKVRALYHSVKK